jgi:outer membrane protein TolC
MKNFFIIFILSAILGQQAFSKDYQIEELLQIAEQNSSIKAAEFLAISQKRFANQQKYWENPVASFDKNSSQTNYSFSQTVPFFGKLQSKFNIEDAQYNILETRRNNLALFVKAETFTLLYEYSALQKKIELAKKRLERLSLVDKYLSHIVLSSPTQISQGRITKDKIKLVERDLIKYRNQLYQTWNKANIYLGLESEPTILITWLDEKNYRGRNFFVEAALENNLNLREQRLLITKYKSELTFTELEKMPDVNVAATNSKNSSGASGKDSNGVGISVSLPLFNRNQEKIISAESKIKAQEFELEFQQKQLINLLNNDLNEFETSLKIAKNFPVQDIEKILTRLSSANAEFKKGILDFITYIELDSQEYQIIDTIIDTQVQLSSSYADLMIKIGTFIMPKNE